jgi:hypothetical protein
MRSREEFESVQALIAGGLNDCAISRSTGIPRPTVRDWRRKSGVRRRLPYNGVCDHDVSDVPVAPYAYLLGMYLGDGCISRLRSVWRLRIALDAKYPGIIQRCRDAIDVVMPQQHAAVQGKPGKWVEVNLCSVHWPCLFPQHGPGKKHLRPIKLEPWQEDIVEREPQQFVRGLIESDGCRVVANDRGVASVRYHFTNHSADIRNLFCWALDLLGIHWTQNSRYMIAVYRKADTARLDEFIGPKS